MKKAIIIISGIILLLLLFLAYEGAFTTVRVSESVSPGYLVVGMDHIGPYEEIGPAFETVSQACQRMGISKPEMIGIYFDHPDSVAKEKLRSIAGVLVRQPADTNLLSMDKRFHYFNIPPGKCINADLKTGDMVSMIIAAMKAYPALQREYVQNHNGKPVTQVYELYMDGYTRFVMQFAEAK